MGVFFTFGQIDHFLSRSAPLAPAPRPSRDHLAAGQRDLYARMATTCRATPRSAHGPPKFVPSPGKAESGSLAPAEGSRVEGRRSPAAGAHSSARADLSGASATPSGTLQRGTACLGPARSVACAGPSGRLQGKTGR